MSRLAPLADALRRGVAPARAWYLAQPARQRRLLLAASAVLALLLIWTAVLAPPLRSLRQAPAKIAQLDAEWAEMQALAAQTRQFRAQPLPQTSDRRAALEATLQRMAPQARLTWQGQLAVVQLVPVSGDDLVRLLDTLRDQAGARVLEAQMQQSSPGLWEGSVAISLPQAPAR